MKPLRHLLALAVLLPLALAGCDSSTDGGGGETFPLPSPPSHRASFTFDRSTLGAGEEYADGETQSSQAIINDSRFDPSDIASARIRSGSVELNMDFPGGADQEITVSDATLTLSAPGVGDRVVAQASDFSLSILTTNAQLRRTVLDITNADITDFLRQEEFTGTLTLNVVGAGDGNYQFTVTFDVDAEVNVAAAAPPPVES